MVRSTDLGQRSQDILMAALACFVEKGFHQSGMRDIAARAGVSVGNLYNHFPDKTAIIAAVAAIEAEQIETLLADPALAGPPPKAFDAFIDAYLSLSADPDALALTAELASEALRKPDLGALFNANRDRLRTVLAGIIEAGKSDGAFDPAIASADTAALIVDVVENLPIRLHLAGQGVNANERDKLRRLMARLVAKP